MKRIFALILILLLLPGPVFALRASDQPNTRKEEIVYGKMTPTGSVENLLVVNSFFQHRGHITDYGRYEKLINLTDDQPLLQQGDLVQIDTPPGDFYYQGQLSKGELPWIIEFHYRMDHVEYTPHDLLGKSGPLEIEIRIRKNPQADPVFFKHYVLQLALHLDAAKFHEIESEEASIATQGQTKMVTFTHLPGKEATYHLRADVNSFELGILQIGALPFKMFMELPDMSSQMNELKKLDQGIQALHQGTKELNQGMTLLQGASTPIRSGSAALSQHFDSLRTGYLALLQGEERFQSGLSDYQEGVLRFGEGMGQLTSGIDQFQGALKQLKEGSESLSTGLNHYASGIDEAAKGISQLQSGAQSLKEGSNELADGLNLLVEKGKGSGGLLEGSSRILVGLETFDKALSFPLTEDEIKLLIQLTQDASQALNEFLQNVNETDFNAFMDLLRQSLAHFDESMDQIDSVTSNLQNPDLTLQEPDHTDVQALLQYMAQEASKLQEETAELRNIHRALSGLDPLIQGLLQALGTLRDQYETVRGLLNRLNNAVQSIKPEDIHQLKEGLHLLSSNYALFHDGLRQYLDGVEAVRDGVTEGEGLLYGIGALSSGLNQLHSRSGELVDGAWKLSDGSAQLSDGLGKLEAGAQEFSQQGSLIDDGVHQLTNGTDELLSGHGAILSGGHQFSKGLDAYGEGIGQFDQGIREFSQGMSQLGDGSTQLTSGMQTLAEQTQGMDQKMQDKIDEFLKDYLPSDFTPKSFVSEKNKEIDSVQFVLICDGLSLPAKEVSESLPEKKESLWEKFLNLFRPSTKE